MPLTVLAMVLIVFVQVRYFLLAAPALVLERIGVFAALGRAGRLSRGQFWRLLGHLHAHRARRGHRRSGDRRTPRRGRGGGPAGVPRDRGALLLVFTSYLSQIIVGAVTTPFTSAVTALQYVDQRIRKEGLDVQLIAASQQGTVSPS